MNILTFLSTVIPSAIGTADFDTVATTINELIWKLFTPLMSVAGALSALWGIYLGVKFWLAGGDEQHRKSAKQSVLSFVIGTLTIFLVVVGAPMVITALTVWAKEQGAIQNAVGAVASVKTLCVRIV